MRTQTALEPSSKPSTPDTALLHAANIARDRATSLRAQADALSTPLAAAYRRRASELELEAWLDDLQAGLPYSEIRTAA